VPGSRTETQQISKSSEIQIFGLDLEQCGRPLEVSYYVIIIIIVVVVIADPSGRAV
jgi:hypothetical protein